VPGLAFRAACPAVPEAAAWQTFASAVLSVIYEKVYQSWTLPEYIMEKEGSREAIVTIKVQRDGKILSAVFEKTSAISSLTHR